MMINMFISISFVYVLLFVISFYANNNKNERHLQHWVLVLAVCFAILTLTLDSMSPFLVNQYISNYLPTKIDPAFSLANVVIFGLFVALKVFGKVTRFTLGRLTENNHHPFIEKYRNFVKKYVTKTYFGYSKIQNRMVVKPKWMFQKRLFAISALFSSLLLLIGLLPFVHLGLSPVVKLLPHFPIVSFILFLELYWYLGGHEMKPKKEVVRGYESRVSSSVNYEEIFDNYPNQRSSKVLAKKHIVKELHSKVDFSYEGLSNEREIQAKINQICSRFKRNNIEIIESYCVVLKEILEERNIIIEDVKYHDISPYIYAAIETLLLKNKKMVVISASDTTEVQLAIKKGLKELNGLQYFWNIASIDDVIEQNIDFDIMIMRPEHLLQESCLSYIKKQSQASNIEALLILEAEQLLSEFAFPLQIFYKCLVDLTFTEPQLLLFSNACKDLSYLVRSVFNTSPQKVSSRNEIDNELFFVAWKAEKDEQDYLEGLFHTDHTLDSELLIGGNALNSGIQSISFITGKNKAFQDAITDGYKQNDHIVHYHGATNQKEKLVSNRLTFHQNEWNIPIKKEQFYIKSDTENNVINSIIQASKYSKEKCFIHVVSQPYLLRNYLTNNVEFFIQHSKSIASLLPRLSSSSSRLAWTLIERMSHSYIPESDVTSYLNQANIKKLTVIEGIKELFKEALGIDRKLLNAIDVKYKQNFYPRQTTFKTDKYYSLLLNPNYESLNNWYLFYKITSEEGEELGSILGKHVYQIYLPGQLHSWNGKMYKIKKIDDAQQEIIVTYESPKKAVIYRQDKTFYINGKAASSISEKQILNEFTFHFERLELPFSVETHGYFEFNNGLQLNEGEFNYTPLNPNGRISSKRVYQKGNALKISIKSEENIKHNDKISFTFAFLLNELLMTLFPQTHSFLSVSVPFTRLQHNDENSKDDQNENNELFNHRMMQLFPKISEGDPQHSTIDDNEISFFVFEDSPIHLGMIESIKHNWDYIIELIDDYLYWGYNAEQADNFEHMRFGKETVASLFDLKGTSELLKKWVTKNHLTFSRTSYYDKKVNADNIGIDDDITDFRIEESNTVRIQSQEYNHISEENEVTLIEEDREDNLIKCDYCQEFIHPLEIIKLDENNNQCANCKKENVNVIDLAELYQNVRQKMVEHFSIELRENVSVEFKSKEEIKEARMQTFIPTENNDPRILGVSIFDEHGHLKILLEESSNHSHLIASLAHELTHIWQYDHLEIDFIGVEDIEGHATWVEIKMLELFGAGNYAYRLKEEMDFRDDVYGKGYKTFVEGLQSNPNVNSPFEMFNLKV
jgi:hypothetical protein